MSNGRGVSDGRNALGGVWAGVGVEEWRRDDVLANERRHVAGVGLVRSMGRCFGDPGDVVAWDEPGINVEGLVGAPAGEGLERRG